MKRALLFVIPLFILASCRCSDEPREGMALTEDQVIAEGNRIADASQGALAGALMSKVKTDGFEGAVSFCHVAAVPLADSLSLIYNADVRRTSFRYRNEGNMPDSTDKLVLATFEEKHELDEVPEPAVVETNDGAIRFYKPIYAAPVCLNCHGMPGEDLTADLHALILEEYPEDRAVGFEEGDIRGAWVIEFANSYVKEK